MFLGGLKRRREALVKDIGQLQDKQSKLSEARLKSLERVAKELGGDKNYNLNINRTTCPYYQRALNAEIEFKKDDDNPLGMSKGSVRSIITILISLSYCIVSFYLVMSPVIPFELKMMAISSFFGLSVLVISSYYIHKATVSGNQFQY